jgi:acylphosphatase
VAGNRNTVRLTAVVHGMVQGVGFRWLTARKAAQLQLAGSAVNRADGTVEVVAEGPDPDVRQLLNWLESDSAPGMVSRVEAEIAPAAGGLHGFHTG